MKKRRAKTTSKSSSPQHKALTQSTESPKPSQIFIEVGTGTPFGLSFWHKFYQCGKLAHLDLEYVTTSRVLSGNYYQSVGSVLHGLLAAHYIHGLFNMEGVVYDKEFSNKVRTDAEKLFRYYRTEHSPEEFGKVAAVERCYGRPLGRGQKSVARSISEAVGAGPLPYTLQPDLETYIENQKKVTTFEKARRVKLRGPGWYLIDHKSFDSFLSDDDRYLWGLQGTAYLLGWEAAHDKKPKGMIFNLIDRSKPGSVHTLFHPYPNAVRIKRLHNWFKLIRQKREQFGPNFANPNHCFQATVCPHFSSGRCGGF